MATDTNSYMTEHIQFLDHQEYKKYNFSRHLGELLESVSKERPEDALGGFEEMSAVLWRQRHVQERPDLPGVNPNELSRVEEVTSLLDELDMDYRSKLDDNFFGLQSKWADVGVSMSREKCLYLQCSLVRLCKKSEIKSLRFWGVFNTPRGNLYVAEADVDLEHHDESFLPPIGQYDVAPEVGVGVNRFVYYVTFSPFDEWKRLPDVRPSDIVQSRKIHWDLTGDLTAAVSSYIPFNVPEEIYLRALIARISAATILAPNDYLMEYVPEEEEEEKENDEIEEEEEEKEPPPKQLKLVVNPDFEPPDIESVEWVHVRPYILPQGRETYKKPPKKPKEPKPPKPKREDFLEEEDEEEEQHEEEEPEEEEDIPEEGMELFSSIENDEGFGEEEPCWNTRIVSSYIESETISIIESLRWPGAINITDGKKSNSIYWGNGNKYIVNGFQPPAPPPLAREFRRKMREQIDPTLDDEKEIERLKRARLEEEEEEGD